MTDSARPPRTPPKAQPPIVASASKQPPASGGAHGPASRSAPDGSATPPPSRSGGATSRAERRSRNVGWQSRDILRTAALVIALYVVIRLLWFANELFLTIFLALLFGLALSAVVDRLARWGVPRGVGAPAVVVAVIALIAGFGALSAPTLARQGQELQRRLPDAIDAVEKWLDAHNGGALGFVLGGTSAPTDSAQAAQTDSARAAQARERQRQIGARTGQTDTLVVSTPTPPTASLTLRERLAAQLSGATRYLFPFLTSTLSVIAGLLLIVFISIYISIDKDLYHRGLMHLFPHHQRERAGEVLSAVAYTLRQWFITQLIAMLVIGTVSTIALLVLNVRAAIVLGFIAGLLEFIPFFGPIISAVPAIAMGFLDSPEKALWVAIAYLIIQELEGHILIPVLMKEGVDLPPVLTIVAQALMVLVFGFLGLMVAVPMLAAIMVPVKMLYVTDIVGDEVEVAGTEDEEERDTGSSDM
ncbi:MAG TPA: AI-2E family transporter [Gemmatimonadaceae bacterium]|nr:AI-2E family transporter [Gemmatimonadaceae bacterium]